MRIVHLTAEFAPIAKAGGLGEVVLGLSRELLKSGHEIEVILPKYDFLTPSKLPDLKIEVPHFKCLEHNNALWSARVEGCPIHLLEARHPAGFFHRGKIYGYDDDAARFIYFTRASLELLKQQKKQIDILHLHDWHVSLAAPLIKDLFKELKIGATVLTLHNVEYQGICALHDLALFGIDGRKYLTKENQINLLKLGIEYADAIVPVSPTYAEEILLPEYGFHLDQTLRANRSKIKGILNGIDTKIWDPATDPHLPHHFRVESALKGKEEIRKTFSLDIKKRPWVGTVSRLVPQKGPHLIMETLKTTIQKGGTFILLGSSPIPELQEEFDRLLKEYADHPQVSLNYTYDEALAHKIYAALDFLIVPSLFEPCGLTQLIAMRYGTIPIVRKTGGLKDTVFDHDDPKIPASQRNGFTFSLPTPESLNVTLDRAFRLFFQDPASIQSLIRRGMNTDFSWKKPAKEYLKLYRNLKCLLDVSPVGINVIANRNGGVESGNCHRKQADLLKEGQRDPS